MEPPVVIVLYDEPSLVLFDGDEPSNPIKLHTLNSTKLHTLNSFFSRLDLEVTCAPLNDCSQSSDERPMKNLKVTPTGISLP